MKTQLSETVKQLIAKARIVSFAGWDADYAPALVARLQAADDAARYLTDEDLAALQAADPALAPSVTVAQQLRDRVREIVDEARQQVLTTFPGITAAGGDLYPEERAMACWRDFWHFLRCVTYGIAGQRLDYTNAEGLGYMNQLYQELKVPLPAMVVGVEGLKAASLKRVPADQQAAIAPYFDHLLTQLKTFQP